ncbi:beta-1,6-N-acetylglucosaminyltransferase [Pseudarthrobacter quantipunctorum]|uniref:Peptide O-xylosyltransferase n=1 Tax=Pseudarthrobacter quantipunctorum TaxID=3128980 RepID=A0ABZ2R693_9MICC
MTVFMIYTFREPELLNRTVKALSPHQVVIHVDAKIDQTPFEAAIRMEDKARVTFLPNRVRVNWGGYSQVDAIRRLVAEAICRASPDEYLIMLSGQDYPIKSVPEIEKQLTLGRGRQYLRYFEVAASEPIYMAQVSHRHHRDLPIGSNHTGNVRVRKARNFLIRAAEKMSSLGPALKPPPGLRVAHGATHFAITASFAEDLESLITPEIENYFRKVFCPEEKFYHSLAALSARSAETGGTLDGGFEPYTGRGNWRYSNLHHIDETLVKVYTEDDWEEVRNSQKFFLRKLESERSSRLLQMIDDELLPSTSDVM